ncbi:fused MFS/spermidine synthase [candidate division KSB1 bacterium]|nr:fused MFS/spermidine synthase [candidate division KSB1 bacterium]
MSPVALIVLGLFFISGFAGLIYQVLWIKTFSFILGNTVYTLSTVLAAYMTGLALGSYVIGKWKTKNRNPLFLFAMLELGTAIFCYILHIVFQNHIKDIGAIGVVDPSQIGAMALRFGIAFLLLLPPTFLMGGTLPVLSQFIAQQRETLGRRIGVLYGANVLGAACGTFVTGYFLIRLLGLEATNDVAVALNGIVALAAIMIAHKVAAQDGANPVQAPAPSTTEKPSGKPVLLLTLLLLSGFTSFGYEIFYARLASYLLGDRIFASTTMLTAFILGIGIGSLLIGRLIDRTGREWLWFASLQILAGISAGTTIIYFPEILKFANQIEAGLGFTNSWQIVSIRFIEAFILMCLPAIAFGASFPCVVRALGRSGGVISGQVGKAYAFNTVGNVLGSLTTGFLILPLAGTYAGMVGMVMVSLLIAGVAVYFALAEKSNKTRMIMASIPAVAIILISTLAVSKQAYPWPREGKQLLFADEDASALITVYKGEMGYYLYGGNSMLSFPTGNTSAESVQSFQAHLPLLLHPAPKDALVIGLGFGVTSGSLAVYDEIETVESIELFSGAVKATSIFHAYNNDIINQPKSSLIIADGRYYLKHVSKKYDIIVSNVSKSDLPGSAGCYTREYFELARERLKPNGLFMVHLYGVGGKMLFKTLRDVFPYVEGFLGYRGTVYMAASMEPIRMDREQVTHKIETHPVFQQDLERGSIQTFDQLSQRHIFDQQYINEVYMDPSVPFLTDDRPILEYSLYSTGSDLFRSAY